MNRFTYNEVPADELANLGVKEVLQIPADGVDRNAFIRWDAARLAVAANFEDTGDGKKPFHEIVINNADARGNSIGFSAKMLTDGSVQVATVSGWHPEGRATLNEEQAATFKSLVEASIALGLK